MIGRALTCIVLALLLLAATYHPAARHDRNILAALEPRS